MRQVHASLPAERRDQQFVERPHRENASDLVQHGRVARQIRARDEHRREQHELTRNVQIARRLFLSEATVKGYVSSMLDKLGCENRTQAGLIAHDAGLVAGER